MFDEGEIFRFIPNCGEKYKVSNYGNILSIHTGNLMKQTTDNGYRQVTIRIGGKRKKLRTHIAVAVSFLKHIPCGFDIVVDHKDNNPLNNKVDNLQLVSNRINSSKDINKDKATSKYTGVSWNRHANKWVAHIYAFGKSYHLGYYFDEHKASVVYQCAKKEIIETGSFNSEKFKKKHYGKS